MNPQTSSALFEMKTSYSPDPLKRAFTLLEMTIVIMVMMALVSIGFISNRMISEWKLGRTASETLRSVYTAQRMYLADYPTATVDSLTNDLILPYIPNSPAAMPTVTSLDKVQLPIRVNVSPPCVDSGNETPYDPSGSPTDSLWDVGQ